MHLSYGELEDFLAEIHGVAPEKRTALKGRLKHFQRLNWPSGTNKGKGARVQYGIGQTMCLAVGMEMLQLGLTPERVVEQFKYGAGSLAEGFLSAWESHLRPLSEPIYYFFSPESLHALRGDDVEQFGFVSAIVSRDKIPEAFKSVQLFANVRRSAFINLSGVLSEFISFYSKNEINIPINLQDPIENWIKVERAAVDKHNQKMIAEQVDGNP